MDDRTASTASDPDDADHGAAPEAELGAEPGPRTPARAWLRAVPLAVAATIVAIDQLTKAWAIAELSGRERVDVVGGLFGFRLVRNAGAAFSLATGATWLFTVIAIVVVIAILRISRRLGSLVWAVVLGLLLGGALGNLVDRLVREPGFARGHVVDFMELPYWPIFNVADSCIVVAAVLIGWLGLRGIGIDGRPVEEAARSGGRRP